MEQKVGLVKEKKIAFFYSSFYPITGGASVHGYNLAKELHNLGYQIHVFQNQNDDFTVKHKRNILSVIWGILTCDIVYVRLPLSQKINLHYLVPKIAKLLGKKVIAELNSPSDEVISLGHSTEHKKKVDKALKNTCNNIDCIVTVSDENKIYCKEVLLVDNVVVIENGGEKFYVLEDEVTPNIVEKFNSIKVNFDKIILWSGNNFPWQGYNYIKELINKAPENFAFLIISNANLDLSLYNNVFLFNNIKRKDLKYITINSHVGIAMYGNYSWSEYGFYGSPLKFYEYLANGLYVIASPQGQMKRKSSKNIFFSTDIDDIINFIKATPILNKENESYRNWKDVAMETNDIIKKYL